MKQRILWWVSQFFLFALGVGGWAQPVYADCLELKNDTFDQAAKTPVVAVRSFCISENYGSIFKAEQDILVQKVRILISGDGKMLMNNTTLKFQIYKEKAADSADPGAALLAEEEAYSVPPTNSKEPSWVEIKDLNFSFKKGETFRITLGHASIDCETRVQEGEPLCADSCGWWSATVDSGPIKPNTNVVQGSMFRCDALNPKERKWRFWKDLPDSCRPAGNLIIRIFAYSGSGKDCKDEGPSSCAPGSTEVCTCPDNTTKTRTCQASGAWGACECTGGPPKACTAGATQKCACAQGDGTQTCKSDGSGWDTCQCNGAPQSCTPGSTQQCVCAGGTSVQTCNENGLGWGACQCGTNKACTAGATQKCACAQGEGVQTCKADGSAWDTCQCGNTSGGKPTVSGVIPKEGTVGKNTEIAISGQGFLDGAKVKIGPTIEALNVKVTSATSITAIVPAETPAGKYNITVENPGGQSNSLLDAFTVKAGGCGCAIGPDGALLRMDPLLWLGIFLLIGLRRRNGRANETV